MRIPNVQTCCCGCSLRLGSAIIGVLLTIMELSAMISYSVGSEDVGRGGSITLAVFSGVMLALLALLLLGTQQERPSFLVPWLLAYGVMTCIEAVAMLIVGIVSISISVLGGLLLILLMAILLFVRGYCLVVVYSYYLSLTGVTPGTV